jgi:uncharacterized protein (TIGR02421 family)
MTEAGMPRAEAAARERVRAGRLERSALEADWRLAEVSEQLRFLLQVSPINTATAWRRFSASGCETAPELEYRPLTCDLAKLEECLGRAPVERVEDPTLGELLREKRDELASKIEMLRDRGTERFLAASLQVYGGADEALVELAKRILYRAPSGAQSEPVEGRLDAAAFAARAERELAHYRRLHPEFAGRVQVSREVPPSLMVSGDRLLVGADTHIPKRRAMALIHHEIGTHLVTRFNGSRQPLRLLACGLAGYDVLQEGLAVVAEFLVGGLNPGRFRVLAGRVLAVRCLTSGASFPETFRELEERFGFGGAAAFTITARVYRAGGLTKDAVYLRGLVELLAYLSDEGAEAPAELDKLGPLLVGKIDLPHVPAIRELLERGVLQPPALIPRYLETEEARERLAFLREGVSPLDLLDRRAA